MNSFHLLPERASTIAHSIDWLFLFMILLTAFFTVLISAPSSSFSSSSIGVAILTRSGSTPASIATGSEWTWSAVPFAILIHGVFLWWSALLFVKMSHPPPADALEIHVVGKQWMWKTQQPSGRKGN